jgi:hypothetical protein
MNYYEQIDPIGEEKANECLYCGIPCNDTYCCTEHKHADNYD